MYSGSNHSPYTPICLVFAFVFLTGCGSTAKFAGDTQTTVTSGSTNTTNTPQILSVAGGNYGVSYIEWAEGGTGGGLNKPCYLNVEFRNLSDVLRTTGNDTVSRELNVCNNGNYNASSLLRPRGSGEPNNPRLPLFMHSLETCDSSNRNNERIKGIRFWRSLVNREIPDPATFTCTAGTPLSPDAISFPCNSEEQISLRWEERSNCGGWSGEASCDAGKIASGVRVMTSVAGEIIGLGLICDAVSYEQEAN